MIEQSAPPVSRPARRLPLASPTRASPPGAAPRSRWEAAKGLKVVVSVALLSWLAWRTDWARLREAFAHMRFEYWLAAVGVYLAAQGISAWRWQLLARPLGFRESLPQFAAFYFIGMYFNLLLPTSVGGDVVRAWCLDGASGRRLAAFLSVLVDRLSGLLILLLVACGGVLACPRAVPLWVAGCVWGLAAGAIVGLLVLPLLTRWTARFERLRRFAEGTRFYLRSRRLLLGTAGLSLGVQLANVVLVWLIGQAISVRVPDAYFLVFVPLVTLLTLLPISLNGMGIREASTVLFLAPVGVGEGAALGLALLWFFALTAASLCGGIVYLFNWYPRPEVQPHHGPIGRDSHQGRAGQSPAAA
jgi:uncharacterized membrane protein YbhN (UPF0104 family)